MQNYTLSLQYELGDRTIIQASYVGDKGSRLGAANFSNMNQLNPKYLAYGDALLDDISMGSTLTPVVNPPYAGFTGNIAQALLPYPQYQGGGVTNRFAYVGKSNYNSLQVTATRRFSKGSGSSSPIRSRRRSPTRMPTTSTTPEPPRTFTTGGWRNRSRPSTTPRICV